MNAATFFSYVILTSITPGPNNIMSMTNAGKYGLKKSFPFNLGVLLGFGIVAACSAAFSSLLYQMIPSVEPYLLAVGAIYILWLAWNVWRDKTTEEKSELSKTNTLAAGMTLQFVNGKVILYCITAMSSFILPNYQSFFVIALFAFGLSFTGFLCTLLWALFGVAFERFFNKHRKLLNAVMALLLVYCAVTMLLEIWS